MLPAWGRYLSISGTLWHIYMELRWLTWSLQMAWLEICAREHYNDVIMTTIASQITSLTVVYSTVYSDADQRKHQSSASLAFVWGIHRDRWIPRTNGQLCGKCFHLMTSSWAREVTNPLVSLLLAGSLSHSDDELWCGKCNDVYQ